MAEPSTNTTHLYALLRKVTKKEDFSSVETNELSNEIMNMAGNNIIAQFSTKLDAIAEIGRAQLESFQAQLESFKESNQAQLESFKESNQAQLESFKESNQAQLERIKESNQVQLERIKESHQTQMDALRESNRTTRWLLGIGFTIIGVMIAYGNFFGG